MVKRDFKTIAANAKSAASMRRPGAVYLVSDGALSWPESQVVRGHDKHPVIILQDQELCDRRGPATITVIPCSSTGPGGACPWDYLIPDAEKAFNKKHIVAYVSLAQPILKDDLGKHLGQLSKEAVGEIKAIAASNLAIQRRAAALPPRSPAPSEAVPAAPAVAAFKAFGGEDDGSP